MTNEYLAVELCEQFFNGIDETTFRRNKKYIALLESMGFAVTEIKMVVADIPYTSLKK